MKAGYKCSTQATLRYGWGLTAKAEKAALLAGTAFHKAADSHVTGSGIDVSLRDFDEVYKDWAQVNVIAGVDGEGSHDVLLCRARWPAGWDFRGGCVVLLP